MFKNSAKTTIDVLEKCIPVIFINANALTKMSIYTDECNEEIGWLGLAVKDPKKNIIYVEDVLLFEQEVHATTTEISPEGLAEFAETLLKEKNGMEIWNKIKLWGHSHVHMATSPSGQDNSQMEIFADNGHDWFIRIITNKRSEIRVDLYLFDQGIIYNNINWHEIMPKEELEIENKINKLLEQLAKLQEARSTKFKENIKKEITLKVKSKVSSYYDNNVGIGYRSGYLQQYNDGKKNVSTLRSGVITSVDAVYDIFTQEELLDLGESISIDELREMVYIYDGRYYSFAELQYIQEAAKAVTAAIYQTL